MDVKKRARNEIRHLQHHPFLRRKKIPSHDGHISPDRKEWIEDRSKYGYKDTPKSQFKTMDVVMTHWIWLRKHYVVPSRFRLMDENGNIIETMEVNPQKLLKP